MRLVCTPHILVGANLKAGVTSLTRRIPKACSWRLTVFARGYIASNEEELTRILTFLLMMREMVATGTGLGILLVSLFHTMKTIATNGGVRVHLAKVWAMMLWAGLLTRSPNHCLHVELKGESFPGILLSQHSPCTMEERILWSMWATSTREWLYILKART